MVVARMKPADSRLFEWLIAEKEWWLACNFKITNKNPSKEYALDYLVV